MIYLIKKPITNSTPAILLNVSVDFIDEMILSSSEIDDFNFFIEFIAMGVAASEIRQKTGIKDVTTHPIITPYEIIGKI